MAKNSIKEISEGAVVSFRSKNASETTVLQGTLESIGTYRSIRGLMNPASYNEAVRQSDPSVPSDLTLLTYFTITTNADSSNPTTKVFANEWIAAGSLNEIALGKQVVIRVDDPLNNSLAIVSLLASAGYKSRIMSE